MCTEKKKLVIIAKIINCACCAASQDGNEMGMQSKRLVTQNLLAAASLFETKRNVRWSHIQDLCVFIDLFCLYDNITALGREAYTFMNRPGSDFFGLLDQEKFVDIKEFRSDKNVLETAAAHLAVFLDDADNPDRYSELVAAVVSPDFVRKALAHGPDEPKVFKDGEEWLRTAPSRDDLVRQLQREVNYHREATFVVRTFLYAAYADVHMLPFTPDGTRSNVLSAILAAEQKVRERFIEMLSEEDIRNGLVGSLRGASKSRPLRTSERLARRVSPLAAVIIDRSGGNKDLVLQHMARLREELKPLRERIRSAETIMFSGTFSQEQAAVKKWQDAFQEIERTFGAGQGLLTIENTLGLAGASSTIVSEPNKPKNWFSAVKLPIEIIKRVIARRTAIEIHDIRDGIPATGRLRSGLERMFGQISP